MNHLSDETSPYLRQHQDNPVDWYPWGEEAFTRARDLDRPLLISIGYSACHWCHVMAHESFEDDETAAILNAHFVAVKVDREERPDIDAIYMEAVQALSGHGGWPLTIFAASDGRPFFGGTYFPKTDHGGMRSFKGILNAVQDAWETKRVDILEQSRQLTEAVAARIDATVATEGELPNPRTLLARAYERFSEMFDHEHGGIGGAPKFPQAPMLEAMLQAHLSGISNALEMVTKTLANMASGGIYDHLGGGFARYSVDDAWQVPHFEKMLYDQAALARVYLHAWQITGDSRWRQVTEEILSYVLRDLSDPSGGIVSSEDADSEGVEGRFYVFSADAFAAALGTGPTAEAEQWYGVSAEGNFEDHENILHRAEIGDLIRPPQIEEARAQLFAVRATRVRPGRDDKVLTEWNAMIGSVFCEAADACGNDAWRDRAVTIGEFLLMHMRRPDGRWMRSFLGGRVAHLGVATDYAWLVEFFTRLYESTGKASWLEEAKQAADGLITLFSSEDGGFYATGADGEALIVRPKDLYDGVTPAAGSVAAAALVRLGALSGELRFAERAQAAMKAAGAAFVHSPLAFSHLLGAALSAGAGPIEIALVGDQSDLLEMTRRRFSPNTVLAFGKPDSAPLLNDRQAGYAYVCRFGACLPPITSREELQRVLDEIDETQLV